MMNKSERSGRRVPSYAEAARGRHDGSAVPEEYPVTKPGEKKVAPPQAPSASTARASTHRGGEQSTIAASYRGPPLVPISGPGPNPAQEAAGGKNSVSKPHTGDAQAQTQKPVTSASPKPTTQTQAHRAFSYAEAARGWKKGHIFNQAKSATSSVSHMASSSGSTMNVGTSPSGAAAASTPITTSPPPGKRTMKGKETDHAANSHSTAGPSDTIPPAVPAIEFKFKPKRSKNKNSKKPENSSSGPSTGQSPVVKPASVAPYQTPVNPTPPPTPTRSVAGQPAATDSIQGPTPTGSSATALPAVLSTPQRSALPSVSPTKPLPSSSTPQGSAPAAASSKSKNKNKNKSKNKNRSKKQASSQPSRTPSRQTVDTSATRPPSQDLSCGLSQDLAQDVSQDHSQASIDAFLESTINVAIAAEEQRQWEFQARELRKMAVVAAHDSKETGVSLWDSQLEWDVKIIWRPREDAEGHVWKVHHDILCRESLFFKQHLPPKNTQGGYVVLDCSDHTGQQLAVALRFMYEKDYEGGAIDFSNSAGTGNNVPDGEPIKMNMFMYICGASVACNSLMEMAVDRIDEITLTILDNNLFTQEFCRTNDLFKFHYPLTMALILLYDQGQRDNMKMMRLAMARLVDVVLYKMLKNESFTRTVVQEWMPRHLWTNTVIDSKFFASRDELFPIEGIDEEEKARIISEIDEMARLSRNMPSTGGSGQATGEDGSGDSTPKQATPVAQTGSERTPASQPAQENGESVPFHPPSDSSGQVSGMGIHTTSTNRQPAQVANVGFHTPTTTQPRQRARVGAHSTPTAGASGHAHRMDMQDNITTTQASEAAEGRDPETPTTSRYTQAPRMRFQYAPSYQLARGSRGGIRSTSANSQPVEMTQAGPANIFTTSDSEQAPMTGVYFAPGARQRVQSTPINSAYSRMRDQFPPTQIFPDRRQSFHVTPPTHPFGPRGTPVYTSQDARAHQTPSGDLRRARAHSHGASWAEGLPAYHTTTSREAVFFALVPGFHAQGTTITPAVVAAPVGFLLGTVLVPTTVLVQGTVGIPIEEALPPTL